MPLELFYAKGNNAKAFSSNLKLNLAVAAYAAQLKISVDADGSKPFLLHENKTNFTLIEPNAVVQYLAASTRPDAFSDTEAVKTERLTVYPGLSSSKFDAGALSSASFASVDVTSPEQIILFSSLYPLAKNSSAEFALKNWFEQFASAVQTAIEATSAVTKLERPKATNTGAQQLNETVFVKKVTGAILPKKDERNVLITSALPYVNNVPHLGNIVGSVLSADIFSRYSKARNYNTLFIGGTDEYGTATETKALEENVTPMELCTKYYHLHSDIYKWFEIGFDYFGRTTTDKQTEIAQHIFLKLHENGFLEEQVMHQLYCSKHKGFLADRYVEGECPRCHYDDARGDQCDKCGNLLNPFELINPHCKLDGETPIPKDSTHVFLSLDKLQPELTKWVDEACTKGRWSKNAKTITYSWLKEGLQPRAITRDLVWGTPVPLKGFEDKVLYVWFDACIGYISITANYTDDWEKWWKQPDDVQLYQFMGKDNVPFHTVVFPSSEIGTREKWTMLHHLNTTEYLQYEGGKFSKSRNIGVFGDNAQQTGIPPSVWRYYLASVRPETSDSQFSWAEFIGKNNNELLANLGNFVNRLVKFVVAKYNGVVPEYNPENCPNYKQTVADVDALLQSYITEMEESHLRKGLELAMAISARGNQFLQDNKLDNSLYNDHPDKSDAVVAIGLNLIYLVSAVITPYMPSTTAAIERQLNVPALAIPDRFSLWIGGGHCIGKAEYLFKRIDEKKVDEWRAKYGTGSK
ncbi:unnamed protein product [Kuraishia capsulata CBS 1993]|uniref:methionine--tRNA ligase n=1 Tax=Kuraishia capsulata CBS 1993 TaxID=1382522 RepID=W6MSW4_9ASCO|nr:uncharacterized protein KUCA_T00005807001 [Kuraishia capsulata CBS 1993]CDK29814.1 unnamed protein product [Kuraishia capsulata CBS 1993]